MPLVWSPQQGPQKALTNMDQWKDIPGYSGLYQVSDAGEVRSFQRNYKGRPMKLFKARGCVTVNLSGATRKVHHLVLEAFVGPRPGGLVTRHLNGDFTDNRISNLTYGTQSENRLDTRQHDTCKIPQDVVDQIAESKASIPKTAALHGVSETYVKMVRRGYRRAA